MTTTLHRLTPNTQMGPCGSLLPRPAVQPQFCTMTFWPPTTQHHLGHSCLSFTSLQQPPSSGLKLSPQWRTACLLSKVYFLFKTQFREWVSDPVVKAQVELSASCNRIPAAAPVSSFLTMQTPGVPGLNPTQSWPP